MRSKEQLENRILWYKEAIFQMEQADADFPDEPIHENDIKAFSSAIAALEHLIKQRNQ